MIDVTGLTIKEAHKGLTSKRFSARELMEELYSQIEKDDGRLHAYISIDKDGALETAVRLDAEIAKGDDPGALAGIPLAVKDNILIKGLPATAGSQILKGYTAVYDATIIQKLKEESAIFLGKTNLDEFAMGSSTENSSFETTRNPHDETRVPGGSSGGSAAAVAADMAVAGLGTDTGGSVRQPAAFCGVVGLKPTYGAVSRFGLVALSSSLDQAGPITKTVEDAAILFDAIKGYDPLDATSAKIEYKDNLLDPKLEDIKELTIGIPEEYFVEGLSKEVGDAVLKTIKSIESLGVKTKKISLPHTKYALSVYYIVMPAEASTNLARYDGIRYGTRGSSKNLLELYEKNRGGGFGPEAKRRIILGTFALSAGYYDAYYDKAQRVRTLIKEDFDKAFESVDVILTPTAPTTAFKIGEKAEDPLKMYLSDIFTIPVNLAGLPAVSIPSKEHDGKLPVGFQLIGKHWREADILGIGQFYERL